MYYNIVIWQQLYCKLVTLLIQSMNEFMNWAKKIVDFVNNIWDILIHQSEKCENDMMNDILLYEVYTHTIDNDEYHLTFTIDNETCWHIMTRLKRW